VNTSISPKVQYTYAVPSSTLNHARALTTVYSNGRVLNDTYNSGLDDSISRLSANQKKNPCE
jgi:hypothetical protein